MIPSADASAAIIRDHKASGVITLLRALLSALRFYSTRLTGEDAADGARLKASCNQAAPCARRRC
jgi:hypothetical protein